MYIFMYIYSIFVNIEIEGWPRLPRGTGASSLVSTVPPGGGLGMPKAVVSSLDSTVVEASGAAGCPKVVD